MRLFFASIFLLALPAAVEPQWGTRGGAQPSAQPAVAGVHTWRIEGDYAYLYKGNLQIGAWSVERQQYLPYHGGNEWGEWSDTTPAEPPASHRRKKPRPKEMPVAQPTPKEEKEKGIGALPPWQLQGVKKEEIHEARTTLSGHIVTQEEGLEAVGKGVLPDDSGKLFLSIWSKDPAKRAAVVADLKRDPAVWAWVEKRCHLWAGDAASPDHFLAKDRTGQPMFAFDGDPMISLQDAAGVELWHDAGYTQGAPSLEQMRKRDPHYRPDDTPGPRGPHGPDAGGIDLNTVLIVAALGVGGLFLLRRKE
jgi:hypothetical protein